MISGSGFLERTVQKSLYLSKGPGVLPPHEVQLAGHREQQRGQVRHREVEQVDVGSGSHVSTCAKKYVFYIVPQID